MTITFILAVTVAVTNNMACMNVCRGEARGGGRGKFTKNTFNE